MLMVYILILAMRVLRLNKARKAYEPMENGIFCGMHKYIFTDDGIASEGKGHKGWRAWETVKEVERAGGIILIYFDTVHAHVFPEAKLAKPDEFYEYVLWRFQQWRKGADQSVEVTA